MIAAAEGEEAGGVAAPVIMACCRAIFIPTSTDTEPDSVRNTLEKSPGTRFVSRSARR
ncbi:MAG: hypothetical protein WDN45_03640 [Caulobacteraceae bacterium]